MNALKVAGERPAYAPQTTPELVARAEAYAATLAPGDVISDNAGDTEHCWDFLHLIPSALSRRGMCLESTVGGFKVRKSAEPCVEAYHRAVKRDRSLFRALTLPLGVQEMDFETRLELGRCVHCGSTLAIEAEGSR